MAKVKIISDGASDLSPELLQEYDIAVVPFYINLGGRILKDMVEIDARGIYDFVDETGILPGTVACSVADFKDEFEKWRGQGYDVVCVTISSDISCTYQNAVIASEEMEGIFVVDSRNLSSGEGHVVLNAAMMARRGMAAADIARELEVLRTKVRASFIIDTLDYMKKGGRCSSVELLGANLLKIKPEIYVEDGAMKVGRKSRGALKKVIEDYVDKRLSECGPLRTDRIFITHTGCPREIVDAAREHIERHVHFDEITETIASGLITCHCGHNTLGILYIEK